MNIVTTVIFQGCWRTGCDDTCQSLTAGLGMLCSSRACWLLLGSLRPLSLVQSSFLSSALFLCCEFQAMMFCSNLLLFKLHGICWNFSVGESLPVLFAIMRLLLFLVCSFLFSLCLFLPDNHFSLILLISKKEEKRQRMVLNHLLFSYFWEVQITWDDLRVIYLKDKVIFLHVVWWSRDWALKKLNFLLNSSVSTPHSACLIFMKAAVLRQLFLPDPQIIATYFSASLGEPKAFYTA